MEHTTAPRRIGLAPLTCLELTPLQLVRTAQAIGFDFVGVRLIPGIDQEARHDMRVGSPMLHSIIEALPVTLPISLEIPMQGWARTADAPTRTRVMLERTRRWLTEAGA